MSECLTEQQLEGLARGALKDAPAAALREHLEACPACREALAEWEANLAFVEQFAGALPRSGGRSSTQVMAGSGDHRLLSAVWGSPRVDDIPGYTIIREIHRGGQGVVYEAIQRSTRRTVALKILSDGPFASERARWRFEREVRLIALLKHPGIVVVHDSGVSDNQHYFAMEYIAGRPLDEHVRSRQLPALDVVRLFQRICDAVSYAHRRGVIHRDLKPSNILVDEAGTPFVLDFGLAKATGDEMIESLHDKVSIPGHLMGTLRYMSPEQTSGKPEEIDVRTDVYSMGVILYELLTGTTPYETTRTDITAAIRNIRETDPPRPSRQQKHIGSELEAIVLKAMEKEPRRRYQSADELSQDLLAWMQGRPVVAKSASSLYVIRKLALRHWPNTVTVASLIITVIAFGTIEVHALLGKARSDRERDTAQVNLAGFQTSHAADVREEIRLNLLGWFLTEWRAGHTAQAAALASRFAVRTPERLAAEFLLDASYPPERLLGDMPESSRQLAYFVAGERALREDNRHDAVLAFQKSADLARAVSTDDLILSLASARLAELGAEQASREQALETNRPSPADWSER